MTTPPLEERIASAGIIYGRKHDIFYRAGLVLQVLGVGVLAVLYPMTSPFYSAGIMLFDLGVLFSAVYLLIWMSWVKKIILFAVLIGILLQALGLFAAPPQYAGTILLVGIGLVCIGSAGIVGKEAYCFGYREGWVLMWTFPVLIVVNLFARESRIFNSLGFSATFLMLLSLAGKKLKQPLLSKCAADVCGLPKQ
jgi:uncharacterized integral membrane protein